MWGVSHLWCWRIKVNCMLAQQLTYYFSIPIPSFLKIWFALLLDLQPLHQPHFLVILQVSEVTFFQ